MVPGIFEAVPMAPAPILTAETAHGCVEKCGDIEALPRSFALPPAVSARGSGCFGQWDSF